MNDHNLSEIRCVYAIVSIDFWSKNSDIEYIGSSTKLASRYRSHKVPEKVTKDDINKYTLLFYKPMDKGFYDYEIKLINRLKPKYNKHHKNG